LVIYYLQFSKFPLSQDLLPGNRIWVEVFFCVGFSKKLHPEHSKDVDDNYQEEGQVTKGTQCGYDNAEQYFHSGPRLSQL